MIIRVILSCFCILLVSCGSSGIEDSASNKTNSKSALGIGESLQKTLGYNFEKPSETFILSRQLREISSLAYHPKDHTFLTNDDESGYFFILDPQSFKIKSKEKFAVKGDYEAAEIIGDDIIISKNTGTLNFYNQSTAETTSYNTELKSQNDVEGLCFEKRTNSLLLACKGQPLDQDKGKKTHKSVYRFDLSQKKLITEPYLTILDSSLHKMVDTSYSKASKSQLKKLNNRILKFAPSGIAIHPVSGDYFLISARGSSLVIIGQNKVLKEVVFLNNNTNPQPEGICFDQENNLYISTEGQGFNGKIFKFNYNG